MNLDRTRFAVIALLSMALVALEIVWTRIFSAEYFYTFAFLAVSLAVLGLGLGALFVRLAAVGDRRTPEALTLAAAAALAAPALVLRLRLDFGKVFTEPAMASKLALAVILLATPFFVAGIALALLFRRHHADMPRLYRADLAGAALGALAAVVAMDTAGVPVAAVLAVLPLGAAALLAAGRLRPSLALLAVLFFASALWSSENLRVPRREPGPVVATHWDSMGKLKVHDMRGEYRNINIDNAANSPVNPFDGDLARARTEPDQYAFDFHNLLRGRPGWRLASVGSGGGGEVLQGLVEGAGEIHAIEVNPAINRMMTTGELADYSGRIYRDPRVRVVSEDGRAYLRRFRGHFDVIVSSSSNSFAALASGAFALSENYLFTTEAFEDYLRALAPAGFLVMEHQFYIPRAVSEALEALRRSGAAAPARHIAVFNLASRRRNVLLVGRRPLEPADVEALFGPLTQEISEHVHLLYPKSEFAKDDLVARIVANGWRAEAAGAPSDISPCTDDRPFVAQMGLLHRLDRKMLASGRTFEFHGFPASKLVVLAILAVVALLALPLLAMPYALRRNGAPRLRAAPWLYFFAIGAGFMALEIVLIQQFTLFIGASAATFATILVTLLFASGIGSRYAAQVPDGLPFAAILGWIALDTVAFGPLVGALGGAPAAVRIAASMLALAPLGFFMGMPFPKATLRVGALVDWGFAVNGVASVLASAAILLVSMTWGFRVALLAGAACYALALGLLGLRSAWAAAQAPGTPTRAICPSGAAAGTSPATPRG